MAIVADRQGIFSIRITRVVDALFELVVDTAMAPSAGFSDIVFRDAGLRIAMRQNTMRRMAIGTHGGHYQSALKQTFPMNAHGIILYYFVLIAGISLRRFAALPVTSRAEIRYVHRESR